MIENKKVVIHKAGGYDKLKFEKSPIPVPQDDEVLIRTKAIGVNYADCLVRWGVYESAKKYIGWPITPGFEFSGIVEKVGPKVSKFSVGQEVFGITRFFGYAEYVCVPERQIFEKPQELSFEEAAGFPAVFITAYHALFQHIRIWPESNILVHSASGGVGSALLQLCKLKSFKTLGVVGESHKIAVAKQFGATHVIDRSKENLWDKVEEYFPEGLDVILDANGLTMKEGYKHLRACGKIIVYGFHNLLPKKGGRLNIFKLASGYLQLPRFNPLDLTTENKGVVGFNISFLFSRMDLLDESMGDLLTWLKQGLISPPKVTTYKLEDVAQAHKDIESGQTTGKLILIP